MNPYNFTFEKFTYNINNLSLSNFNLSINQKTLFDDASLTLSYGDKYGLIGKNGYGKTSLLKQFKYICNEDKLRILYVEQELILDERKPIQFILDSNIKMKYYQERIKILEENLENDESEFNEEIYKELEEAQNNLSSYNPEKEEGLVNKILFGLGFTSDLLDKPSNLFSGGWQMRLSLARSLYLEPDLLLLDEPTNHLDLEAIIWLSDYLQSWKKIAVIVSHNIGFINNVCSHIINIEDKKSVTYKGNYNKFKSVFNQKIIEMKKEYEKFEKKIKDVKKKGITKDKLEEFIKKNQVPRPEKDYDIKINFLETKKYNSNVIKIDNLSFSYDDNKILENITLGISMDSRITLVGLNGCGKSTLIKLIKNELNPTSGEIIVQHGIKIGYYSQHFDQQLPFDKTPIEFLQDYTPSTELIGKQLNKYEIIRSYLGKIKLESSAHNKLIGELSGGQKARVAFVKLLFDRPQILLLDEPTNHLDIETVEILIESLESFEGGILLITHEPEMIERLSNQIWLLDKNTHSIKTNIESYDEYHNIIIDKLKY
jgi:ATP-binding cassette subfamily F protein 1